MYDSYYLTTLEIQYKVQKKNFFKLFCFREDKAKQ